MRSNTEQLFEVHKLWGRSQGCGDQFFRMLYTQSNGKSHSNIFRKNNYSTFHIFGYIVLKAHEIKVNL